jgi:hypothetical protein
MSKLLDSLLKDVLDELKTPEVQSSLESHIIRPVISSVLHILYPYLLGVMLLWIIMFVCVALILLILVRGSLMDIPALLVGVK